MSGHSKWASIKHKKGANDAKRGQLFSKISKEITVAAKMGGPIIENNARLKMILDKAKAANMPTKNIENAIKRGSSPNEGENYLELTYEAYGPEGVALMIECLTDNKNRSVSQVRSTLTKNGGNLGEYGSVAWQFKKKGAIHIEKDQAKEDFLMNLAIDSGADDVEVSREGYTVICEQNAFPKVLEAIKIKNLEVINAEICYLAKNHVELSKEKIEKIQKLVHALEDLEDVQSVSSNETLVL